MSSCPLKGAFFGGGAYEGPSTQPFHGWVVIRKNPEYLLGSLDFANPQGSCKLVNHLQIRHFPVFRPTIRQRSTNDKRYFFLFKFA